MDEKIIKINQNNYLVATGDVKQIKGNITKDELLRIYKLRDMINMINEEINNQKNELNWIQDNKQFHKKELLKFRMIAIPTLVFFAGYIGVDAGSMLSFILTGVIYTALYCLCEKALKELHGTKEQNEIDEKNINASIENNYEKIKKYEKELIEIIERTNYQEVEVDREKTWDDLLYTEEEIRLYMKEAPAPFDLETIFATSEKVEEQTDNLQKELNESRLVKRLTPSKNNGNK